MDLLNKFNIPPVNCWDFLLILIIFQSTRLKEEADETIFRPTNIKNEEPVEEEDLVLLLLEQAYDQVTENLR